jgi:hypothetical protein
MESPPTAGYRAAKQAFIETFLDTPLEGLGTAESITD